ncbi:hypothetical protein BX666DRAFT_2022669 [Dichotomocladium elegans]|nr:hypothetical protein BX666DRAFT_2022669 [Dichotomocladium elegans]
MAFKFNFTANLEEIDQTTSLDSSLHDLNLDDKKITERAPCHEYKITSCILPGAIQADILELPNVDKPLYKRALGDVKYQMAMQDTLCAGDDEGNNVVNMLELNSNSDLVRGVYEGGFKTWECSLDLVEYLAGLPKEQTCGKRVLELGCGSALPSLFMLMNDQRNQVDVQDYNEQVIQYITIPNILLNTVLDVQKSGEENLNDEGPEEPENNEEEKEQNGPVEEEEEDDVKDEIIGESVTCDAEAELPAELVPTMLERISQRSKAYYGDWTGLPDLVNVKYDIILTSETVYSEDALPALVRAIQKTLKKPDGVCYVAAKTVYFGVGGGVLPFCNLLQETQDEDKDKLVGEKVFESDSTVKREILKVTWVR